MPTLTFGAQDGGNIGYIKNTGAPVVIGTNVYLLTETQMRRRLLCDIIKDAVTKTPLTTEQCKQIIGAIYCNSNIVREPNVDSPPSPFNQTEIAKWVKSDHRTLLAELEDVLDEDLNIKARTTELINQPKLSTVGSNTKISDAIHVFWESGFGSESIMRSKTYDTIRTPAALMDPLNKEATNVYFPPAHLNIVFDKTFTKRLGFPDTKWDCTSGVVSIQYTQLNDLVDPVILKHQFSETTTKEDVKAGQFAEYIKGNKEKNEAIATNAAPNAANMIEIIKIVETKELGDVAQVWLYLAYLIEKDLLQQREKALMITTDSVVYLFCQLLNLSCAYTGSRAKVESKKCSIFHYIAGEPDYGLKIKNMVQIACDIAEQKILTQKFILAHIIADPALLDALDALGAAQPVQRNPALDFRYMGFSRTGTLVKRPGLTDETTGKAITDTDRIEKFIAYFRGAHDELNTKHQGLLEEKKKFDANIALADNIPQDDAAVNAKFEDFNATILPYRCEIYFTKVKGEYKGYDYILQDKFRNILYPNWNWMIPTAGGGLLGGSSIDKVNYMTNETSSSKSISKEINYVGGIRSDIDDEITFLEATILAYSYLQLKIPDTRNLIKLTKSIEEEFDENEISLFAITYDNFAYNINDTQYQEFYEFVIRQQLLVYEPSTQQQVSIHLLEENILVIGVVLSEYLYFAKNKDEETILIGQDLMYRRQLRSDNVPVFESSTFCAGRRDINTKQKIPIGSSINILGLCHDAKNIVELIRLKLVSGTAQTLLDVFASVFDKIVETHHISYNKVARWYIDKGGFSGFLQYLVENYQRIDDQDKHELEMRCKEILSIIRNILAYIYTWQQKIYEAYRISMYATLLALIPTEGVNILGCLMRDRGDGIIEYLRSDIEQPTPYFGGSNKYLLKKIKSKKNRVKKIKSKKNRAKKIKSKQHRLKKIKSQKFTRKNKKSKNGVI
jgi:hypothetical protein